MDAHPGTTLLVASGGDPLSELHALSRRFAHRLGRVEWATFDSPQTRELLGDAVVHPISPVLPRDLRGAMANLPLARRLFAERGVTRVISTGAAVAVPFAVTAREQGLAVHYVETAARVRRPGLTGTLVAKVPGVHLYSQHPWQRSGWDVHGSVFDGFLSVPTAPATRVDKVVVTFGTQRGHGFRRAAARLAEVLPQLCTPSAEVLWQTGATDTFGLGIDSSVHVPYADLSAAIGEADLVIGHAGVGSTLLGLGRGRVPVLVPRRRAHHEHPDDQQVELADHLQGRGLATHLEVEQLDAASLLAATARTALVARPGTFELKAEAPVPPRTVRRAARVAVPSVPRQRVPDERRARFVVPTQRGVDPASRRFTLLPGGVGDDHEIVGSRRPER